MNTKITGFRLPDYHRSRLEKFAKDEKMTMSAYLKVLIEREALRREMGTKSKSTGIYDEKEAATI